MREIKFRVWLHNPEAYDNRFFISADGITGVVAMGFCGELGSVLKPEEYVLEQFTGLKDKNGVEIYEGDMVQTKTNSLKEDENMEVYYDQLDGAYGLRDPAGVIGGHLLFFHIGTPVVIGNIHENPELLVMARKT